MLAAPSARVICLGVLPDAAVEDFAPVTRVSSVLGVVPVGWVAASVGVPVVPVVPVLANIKIHRPSIALLDWITFSDRILYYFILAIGAWKGGRQERSPSN